MLADCSRKLEAFGDDFYWHQALAAGDSDGDLVPDAMDWCKESTLNNLWRVVRSSQFQHRHRYVELTCSKSDTQAPLKPTKTNP